MGWGERRGGARAGGGEARGHHPPPYPSLHISSGKKRKKKDKDSRRGGDEWRCPVCNYVLRKQDLYVDKYFLDMLNKADVWGPGQGGAVCGGGAAGRACTQCSIVYRGEGFGGEPNGCGPGRSLRDQSFFFFAKDRPKGPPTANRQLPSTANRHQPPTTNRHQPPPTASGDQPPTANHCQPPPTTNHQPPTAANHHQPPPTASCQPPTANRRQPPTAKRHQPWLSTWSARGLFWENWFRNTFFFPVKDRPDVDKIVEALPPTQCFLQFSGCDVPPASMPLACPAGKLVLSSNRPRTKGHSVIPAPRTTRTQ